MKNTKTLSLVIPCYNEASRGRLTENDLSKRLAKLKSKVQDKVPYVIFVNDGSHDTTASEIKIFIEANHLENSWFLIDEKQNKGKGHALLVGMEKAANLTDFVGYIDADLSTPVEKMLKLPLDKNPNTTFVGRRVYTKKQSTSRAILSHMAKLGVRLFTGVKVKDTQCPFKVVPSFAFQAVKDNLVGYRWIYDIELLWELQEKGFLMVEVPVLFRNMEESTLQVYSALKRSAKDLFSFCQRKANKKKKKGAK